MLRFLVVVFFAIRLFLSMNHKIFYYNCCCVLDTLIYKVPVRNLYLCSENTMSQSTNMQVLWTNIKLVKFKDSDFISLTDIAKYKESKTDQLIQNRMRNRNTLEFLGLWEKINNPDFKPLEFEGFAKHAWLNSFLMSPKKRIEWVGAIWIITKSWKYTWWTFAHKDIALEFANRISVEFKLLFIKEFQRLKEQEMDSKDRNVKRFLTKINYKIHTDAIRDNLIPKELSKQEIHFVYADEADVLNISLFWKTAKEWRDTNPDAKWNIRDDASIEQLIVLSNIESMNAEYIKLWLPQSKRITLLNQTAISQIKSLLHIEIKNKLPK